MCIAGLESLPTADYDEKYESLKTQKENKEV
jgi:hypothetical protein